MVWVKALAAVAAEGWARERDEGKVEDRVGEAWARDAAEAKAWVHKVTAVNILDAPKNHAKR